MIDEKKIERAIEDYVRYSSVEDEYPGTEGDAFRAGTKWAIHEFLKDLWHPISEKPNKARLFLYKTIFKGYGLNKIIDGNEWKYIIKYQKATQWLYIDDLFSKEGDNHD